MPPSDEGDEFVDVGGLRPVGPEPVSRRLGDDDVVVVAGPGTDVFTDPAGSPPIDAAPGLALALDGPPVVVSARVEATLDDTFDAGALLVRFDTGAWAKLALERSPRGRPTIVSVVTTDTSDDANGVELDRPMVDLRVAWDGTIVAFHHRVDDGRWELVRLFSAGGARPVALELLAQSPIGDGCEVVFSDLRLARRTLADLRDGT